MEELLETVGCLVLSAEVKHLLYTKFKVPMMKTADSAATARGMWILLLRATEASRREEKEWLD